LPRPAAGGCRRTAKHGLPGGQLKVKPMMRLRKTDWMLVLVVAGSIAGFGNWLQGEMNRASLARVQRQAQDSRGVCAGMSARDAEMMDKGELWCGSIDPARADSLSKE
jgi:hypothetical protein